MKSLYIIFLILIIIFCSGFSESVVNISFQQNVEQLERLFKSNLSTSCYVVYTKVPRGLIISFNEKCFFSEGEARIKESSLYLLDTIAELLVDLPNVCVVEDHTEENNLENSDYNEDWELSIARASNIVQYMIAYKKVPVSKLFALGFGEYMPFLDNVAPSLSKNIPKNIMNSRIDFVIIDYEAKR